MKMDKVITVLQSNTIKTIRKEKVWGGVYDE
jgi:hypothetical protein